MLNMQSATGYAKASIAAFSKWLRVFPLPLLIGAVVAYPTPSLPLASTASAEAEDLAERMLNALCGRTAWASTTNTVNDSQQNWDGEPALLRVVITMDFEQPRFRVDTRADRLHVVRVVDGDRHWRVTRDGSVSPVPEEVPAADRRWYQAHVYRTLHRIARRDPAIRPLVGKEGRLEVHEGAARIAWYALDRSAQPYRYGAHDDDIGSIFGPWEAQSSGIRHPVWVSRDNGRWRAMLKSFDVNVALDEKLFTPPR